MSFFDDASWVLIPEGIKEDVVYAQKPTNGTGDLTFTRASDATRTNSAGVIERTPWNLFTQSVWTGGGALPTGWSYSFNTGTSAPVTSLYSTTNVAYSFVASSTRQVFNQSLSYITGQSYHLSVLVEAVSGSVRIDQVLYFNATGTQTFFKDGVPANASDFVVAGSRYAAVIVSAVTTSQQVRIGNGCVGNSTGTVVLSQPQLVEGTDAKPYFATTNRQDVPRLDYRNADGTLNSCPRLLLEPQRTNSIRNSTMVGAVAGSPGTLPTNWNVTSGAGLTQTVVGLGSEIGIQYIDLRFNGIATASSLRFVTDTTSGVAATPGQIWSNSVYAKLTAGTMPFITLRNVYRTSGGAAISTPNQQFNLTSSLTRSAFTDAAAPATTAFLQQEVLFTLTIGLTYDFTIRIAAPQMELGAYATTFIPTTTAAVTRLVDAANKTGVSSLINSPQGSLFIDARSLFNGGTFRLFSISDGTSNNRITVGWSSVSSTLLAFMILGGNIVVNNNISAFDQTANNKILFRWGGGNFNVFINGVNRLSLTSVTMPTANLFNRIGFDLGSLSSLFEGNVNQAAIFPTPLTDAQCIQLTTI